MATVVTDVGTKYKQQTTTLTPNYVVGGVRMEDSHRTLVRKGNTTVICVADGHGSVRQAPGLHTGGRECADAACDAAARQPPRELLADPVGAFAKCQAAVLAALRRVHRDATTTDEAGVLRVNGSIPAWGTTLSVLVLRPNRVSTFSWVGDSVGILVRRDESVTVLGRPHSVDHESERRRVLSGGGRRDGKYFEYRVGTSTFRIAVSRSLGHIGHHLISHAPETQQFTPVVGDRVLVATDGLWDVCSHQRAAQLVATARTEAEACEALLQVAVASPNPRDNVTIACTFVGANLSSSSSSSSTSSAFSSHRVDSNAGCCRVS